MADEDAFESKSGMTKVVPMSHATRAAGEFTQSKDSEEGDDQHSAVSQAISKANLLSVDGKHDARNGEFGGSERAQAIIREQGYEFAE